MSNPMWAPPGLYPPGPAYAVSPASPAYAAPTPTPAPVGPDVKPGRGAPKLYQPVVLKDAMRFFQVPAMAWWWGLLGLVAFGGLFFGVELIGALVMAWADPNATEQNTTTPVIFLLNNAWIALLIPASILVSFWFYRQGFGWLSSVIGRFRWKWFFVPLGIFVVGYLIENLIELVLYGSDGYGLTSLTWQPTSLVMIVGILVTTPLQCAGEEYMARGVVPRLIAGVVRQRQVGLILAALGSSGLFMYLHSAQDVWLNSYYFATGLVMWWSVYRTGGLEISVALHIVNNLFSEWMLPFQDISGMFDRSSGTGSPILLIYVLWEFMLVLIVDYIARGRGLVRMSAPAAAVPVVLRGGDMVAKPARETVVATKADLPRLDKTPRLTPAAPVPNQWFAPAAAQPYPVAPGYPPPGYPGAPLNYPMPGWAGPAPVYPAPMPGYPSPMPVYPAPMPAYPAPPPGYAVPPPAYPGPAYPVAPPNYPSTGYPGAPTYPPPGSPVPTGAQPASAGPNRLFDQADQRGPDAQLGDAGPDQPTG